MNKGLPGEEEGKECSGEDVKNLWEPDGRREHGELQGQKDVLFELYSVRELENLTMIL